MIPKLTPSNMENFLVFFFLARCYFFSLRLPISLECEGLLCHFRALSAQRNH